MANCVWLLSAVESEWHWGTGQSGARQAGYAASITLAGGVNYKSGPPGNCRLVRVNYTVSRTLDIVDDSDDLLL
jgi:hypothetical protein